MQAKLAATWTSLMFLLIYVDYFHLHKPGVIDELRAGTVGLDFPVTPLVLTLMFTTVAVPAVMVMLSMTLPARANRITNLVIAALYIPTAAFNVTGETWDWFVFYAFAVAIELVLLAYILRSAWAWPRISAADAA